MATQGSPLRTSRSVLLASDDASFAESACQALTQAGMEAAIVTNAAALEQRLDHQAPALLLVDYRLGDMAAEQLIDRLSTRSRRLPFLVIAEPADEQRAAAMLAQGAVDWLVKGSPRAQWLPQIISRALAEIETAAQLEVAKQAVAESDQLFHDLVECCPDAIIIHQDERIVFANATAERLFSNGRAEPVTGMRLVELFPPSERVKNLHLLRELYQNPRSIGLTEQTVQLADGTIIELEATSAPCLHANRPARVVTARDISRRKDAEARLREHQAQLAHVLRVDTMGKMVSELAHEINQPLHAIANYSGACRELIESNPALAHAELVTWVENIGEQADRAGAILRQVGRFVRKEPRRRETVELAELQRTLVRLLEIDARAHQARIRLWQPPERCSIVADRVQIEQVLVNLVRNAIEAMRDVPVADRLVTIRSAYRAADVEVSIEDCGCGCNEEELAQMFEPFFTTRSDGMGLGLAISRSIIEAHQGRLWATRNEQRGLTVHFTVPVADIPAMHPQPTHAPA